MTNEEIVARRATLQRLRSAGGKAMPTASPATAGATTTVAPTRVAPAPPGRTAPVMPALDGGERERARIAANHAPRPLGPARDEPWRPFVGPDGIIANGFGWGGVSWECRR